MAVTCPLTGRLLAAVHRATGPPPDAAALTADACAGALPGPVVEAADAPGRALAGENVLAHAKRLAARNIPLLPAAVRVRRRDGTARCSARGRRPSIQRARFICGATSPWREPATRRGSHGSAPDPAGERTGGAGARAPDPAADSQAAYRIDLLIRALDRHEAPCVLALDEVKRLQSLEAAALISTLLRRAPRNLHVGMAFRERPPGLDIAMFALEGRGATVTAEDLRFSKNEIARFFDRRLSRQELAAVVDDSAGWPLALHICRNAAPHGAANAAGGGDDDTVAGWIEMRLWRGLPVADRDFMLDIALFDRVDPDLIDEVTGARNAGRRLASMRALAGLVSTTGGDGSLLRLHPLIEGYCERRRFEETPERFRTIHRGIAQALARRGRVVEALRHATAAGDTAVLARIAESTRGVRLWLEQGLEGLRAVDGLLTAEVVSQYPRLALVRCVALTVAGDIDGAKRLYGAAAEQTAGFTCDREGGDDRALQTDHIFVQGLLHLCGCSPYGTAILAAVADAEAVANTADTDPLLRGMFSLGMCIARNQMTAFDAAVEWAGRARRQRQHQQASTCDRPHTRSPERVQRRSSNVEPNRPASSARTSQRRKPGGERFRPARIIPQADARQRHRRRRRAKKVGPAQRRRSAQPPHPARRQPTPRSRHQDTASRRRRHRDA